MIDLAVVLNAHENSPVFRDTLESVLHHWTRDVLVVADAKNWGQFRDADFGVRKLEGFYHGKSSAPYRNLCLGLMKAWETWGESKGWYCYLEYDCLVGSDAVRNRLSSASERGVWIMGNDHRADGRSIPFMERFEGSSLELHYLLGCCVFFNSEFMKELARRDFFNRFLWFTNFNVDAPRLVGGSYLEEVYDLSEFLYPTLAMHYGGRVEELARWNGSGWSGDGFGYPMRFRPDLDDGPYEGACVMHPLKSFDSAPRAAHRRIRNSVENPLGGTN